MIYDYESPVSLHLIVILLECLVMMSIHIPNHKVEN